MNYEASKMNTQIGTKHVYLFSDPILEKSTVSKY